MLNNSQLVKFIQNSNLDTIKQLVNWMVLNLSKNEEIEISQWLDELFYIEVVDRKIKYKLGNSSEVMRIWFTVNIKEDTIVWNNDGMVGGNCGTRDRKWIKELSKSFPFFRFYRTNDSFVFHWYKPTPSSRTQEKKKNPTNVTPEVSTYAERMLSRISADLRDGIKLGKY